MLNLKSLIPIFCVTTSLLFAENWSLQDPTKGWNSQDLIALYHHNSELQTQWAWGALSHYRFKGDEHVLDFGCGDGKVSAFLSHMTGDVTGVDLSADMVKFSSHMFHRPNLRFQQTSGIDFENFTTERPYDLVTSFCVFHLVPNPLTVLSNIRKLMVPGGKLVMTLPTEGSVEFFCALRETLAKYGHALPAGSSGVRLMREPETAQQVLEKAGFDVEYIAKVDTLDCYESKEAFVIWAEGTLAANWNIPREIRRAFFTDFVDSYTSHCVGAIDEEGFVSYRYKRIDILASARI